MFTTKDMTGEKLDRQSLDLNTVFQFNAAEPRAGPRDVDTAVRACAGGAMRGESRGTPRLRAGPARALGVRTTCSLHPSLLQFEEVGAVQAHLAEDARLDHLIEGFLVHRKLAVWRPLHQL